jgi:hypothetical protein
MKCEQVACIPSERSDLPVSNFAGPSRIGSQDFNCSIWFVFGGFSDGAQQEIDNILLSFPVEGVFKLHNVLDIHVSSHDSNLIGKATRINLGRVTCLNISTPPLD